MHGILGTSLEDLIGASTSRRTAVPPELAAFVALEMAEGLAHKPAVLEPDEVAIMEDGRISVFPKRGGAPEALATRSIGVLLARILTGSTSLVPPALNALVNRATDAQRGYGDLATLRKDLEAVLIPLNRGAARRVLARFVRDVTRPSAPVSASGPLTLDPSEASTDAVDELLSALDLGAEKTEPQAREPEGPVPDSREWQPVDDGAGVPLPIRPPSSPIVAALGAEQTTRLAQAPRKLAVESAEPASGPVQTTVIPLSIGDAPKAPTCAPVPADASEPPSAIDLERGGPLRAQPVTPALPAQAVTELGPSAGAARARRRSTASVAIVILALALVALGMALVQPRWLGLSFGGAGARERPAARQRASARSQPLTSVSGQQADDFGRGTAVANPREEAGQ